MISMWKPGKPRRDVVARGPRRGAARAEVLGFGQADQVAELVQRRERGGGGGHRRFLQQRASTFYAARGPRRNPRATL
jgi:hypothetical protein